ncbi:hypothetical protein ACOMCU_16370 [Lysinibacillus sp. UGB7]|uniref:hypothetical protein n=1 Tax=Lysinibacillus sp. UGB7 TaxID=3411039 RepID=UPI003B799CBB
MKANVLNGRTTLVYSTSIDSYRRSKTNKNLKVENDLPSEIKRLDIGWWGTIFKGVFTFLTVVIFIASLLFMALIFGYKF